MLPGTIIDRHTLDLIMMAAVFLLILNTGHQACISVRSINLRNKYKENRYFECLSASAVVTGLLLLLSYEM